MTEKTQIAILVILSAWMIVSATIRLSRRKSRQMSKPPESKTRSGAGAVYAILQGLGTLLIAYAVYRGGSMFLQPRVSPFASLLAAALVLSALIDVAGSLAVPVVSERKIWLMLVASLLTLVAGAASVRFLMQLRSIPAGSRTPIHIESPVRGSWRVMAGGPSRYTNYHHGHPDEQDFAVDLVAVLGKTEGLPVYAPLSAKVTEVVDDQDTNSGIAAEGNYIVLQAADGTEIWLAHLQENSIKVKSGASVTVGEQIAAVGATGSALAPHLHIHAQAGAKAVPLLFGRQNRFLIKGDVLSEEARQ